MHETKKLIIFDLDGTLAERDTGELLAGVAEWFTANKDSYLFAVATNQGGVGLRQWMERDGFGEPGKYPDEGMTTERIQRVIGGLGLTCRIYICYAYQTKAGKWAPCPAGKEGAAEWLADNRKPSPGMLLQAIQDAGVDPGQALYVGNGPEDAEAATRAGIGFMKASEFFSLGR